LLNPSKKKAQTGKEPRVVSLIWINARSRSRQSARCDAAGECPLASGDAPERPRRSRGNGANDPQRTFDWRDRGPPPRLICPRINRVSMLSSRNTPESAGTPNRKMRSTKAARASITSDSAQDADRRGIFGLCLRTQAISTGDVAGSENYSLPVRPSAPAITTPYAALRTNCEIGCTVRMIGTCSQTSAVD
jgi:hypothetical protein